MTNPDPSLDDLFLPLAFSLYSNPGAYAVLAGAGVSRGAGLPTAWDIVVDLIAQIAEHAGDSTVIDEDSAAPWYESKYGRTPTYSDVVEQLALTPTERQGLLKKYLERTEDDATDDPPGPSQAHRAIARLMQAGIIRVVITMNFDRLFEQALRDLLIEPTVVATDGDAEGLAPLHTVQHCVIHLHGDYLNAISMRNTTDELSGYGPHMTALLSRVLGDYGLLIAGWSAEHDHALRDAVAAHYPSLFTMGWISPGRLTDAAATLATNKKALVLQTTADNAFGHLADQVEAMRERRARHPLSLAVASTRVKRELSGNGPAISSHDMLAAEFARLHLNPAFHLANYSDLSNYPTLLRQAVEAAKIPAAVIATLAYWGTDETDRWWTTEIERFGRPAKPLDGVTALIDLPLVAGSLMFYSAGVASTLAQRYDLLIKLFRLQGHRAGGTATSIGGVLTPAGLTSSSVVKIYAEVCGVVTEALGVGIEPVDEALQTFEIVRLTIQTMEAERFAASVGDYETSDRRLEALSRVPDGDQGAQFQARVDRDRVVGRIAEFVRPHGAHVLASERIFFQGNRIWGSPVAERIAEDVQRLGAQHPLVEALRVEVDALWLALRGVSVAVGREGDRLQLQGSPVGYGFFPSDECWLDTGRPPNSE